MAPESCESQREKNFMWGIEAGHLPNRIVDLKDLNLIKSNGMNWIGVDFIWKKISPEYKEYDFTFYDQLVSRANSVGLEVLGRLGNGYNGVGEERNLVPDWAKVDESYPEKLSQYISKTVSHFREKIGYWVVENEANNVILHRLVGWRRGNWGNEILKEVLKRGCEAVRGRDPKAKVVVSVCSAIPGWVNYLKKVDRWEVDYDVVGLQDYPFGILEMGRFARLTRHAPLDLFRDRVINRIKNECEVARRFKPDVIFTEMGFHTRFEQEKRQAEALRYEVRGALAGGARGCFWFCYKDDPTDFPEQEKHFGLVRADGTPKPAWYEYGKIIHNPVVRE